jgi:hypothetical protein
MALSPFNNKALIVTRFEMDDRTRFKVDKKEFSYDNPDLCVPCHQVRVCRSQRAIRNSKALPQWIAFTKDTQQENFFLGTERTTCGQKGTTCGQKGTACGAKEDASSPACWPDGFLASTKSLFGRLDGALYQIILFAVGSI